VTDLTIDAQVLLTVIDSAGGSANNTVHLKANAAAP
jgi:hypothetical protein